MTYYSERREIFNEGDSRPRVAVLLAAFNGRQHIVEQVNSILWQTHCNLKLVVRDDGSSDQTLDLVRGLAEADRRVELIDDSVPTGSATGNFLSMLCSVDLRQIDFVAFSDQDDIWMPDKLSSAVNLLLTKQADGYSSNLIAFSDSAQQSWYINKAAGALSFDYLFQGASAGCTYVLSKRAATIVVSKVRPLLMSLPKNLSHDWMVYACVRSAGLRWVFDAAPKIFYRQHATNAYGDQQGLQRIRRKIKLLNSKWYRQHILWNSKIIENKAEEAAILRRVKSRAFRDRLWLVRRVGQYRRDRKEQILLGLMILFDFY